MLRAMFWLAPMIGVMAGMMGAAAFRQPADVEIPAVAAMHVTAPAMRSQTGQAASPAGLGKRTIFAGQATTRPDKEILPGDNLAAGNQ